MNTLRDSPYADNFSRQITISVILHVALFLFFAVKAAFIPSDEMLIRNAIRVDMVALPDKPASPTAPAEAPPAPKVVPVEAKAETKKPDPVAPKKIEKVEKKDDLKKIQENQRKALEQLKAQAAIDKMKNEMADKNAKPNPKPPTFAGNVINKGDSLTGLEKIEFDRYFGDLEKKLKQHWNLPGYLVEAQLKAQALVMIDSTGQVLKRQIVKSSGNDVFDGQVLAAVDAASPFPVPPARLKDVLAFKGIVFNFPD